MQRRNERERERAWLGCSVEFRHCARGTRPTFQLEVDNCPPVSRPPLLFFHPSPYSSRRTASSNGHDSRGDSNTRSNRWEQNQGLSGQPSTLRLKWSFCRCGWAPDQLRHGVGHSPSQSLPVIIIYLPRTHTTQRARRTNSIWQVRQGWSSALTVALEK